MNVEEIYRHLNNGERDVIIMSPDTIYAMTEFERLQVLVFQFEQSRASEPVIAPPEFVEAFKKYYINWGGSDSYVEWSCAGLLLCPALWDVSQRMRRHWVRQITRSPNRLTQKHSAFG